MGDKIERYISMVSRMLYERDGKFPDREVHGVTNLKCTNGWLTGVMGAYAVGKKLDILSSDTCRFYDRVFQRIAKEDDKNRLTDRRDVRFGNRLLLMSLIDCSPEILKGQVCRV